MSAQAFLALGSMGLQSLTSMADDRTQARFAFAQASRAKALGVSRAAQREQQGRAAVATARTRAAASGFTADGSAEDVIANLAQEWETSRQRALWEGFREADQHTYRGKVLRQSANIKAGIGVATTGLSVSGLMGAFG